MKKIYSFYKINFLLACLLFFTNVNVFANDFNVTVCGTILFRDANTVTDRPLAGAIVEVWDSDVLGSSLGDDLMGFGLTDVNGNYCIEAIGGDPGNHHWSRPDVYIKVLMQSDDGVLRLSDELNFTQSYDSDHHNHDDVEGRVDMGGLILGTDISSVDQGTKVLVFVRARNAMQDFVTQVGPIPSGYYDVEYFAGWVTGVPWTNVNTTHWPRNGSVANNVNLHEFAHTVRHALDGDLNELLGDNAKYTYLRNHGCNTSANQGFAFNEGWAEFWAHQVGARATTSFGNECDVADMLATVSALLPNGRADMVRVLRENSGKIHSFPEFCAKADLLFPGQCNLVGVAGHSLTVPVQVDPEAVKQQVLMQRKLIDTQNVYARHLTKDYNAAKRIPRLKEMLKNDSLLYLYLNTLERKHLLDAELKITKLTSKRLKQSVAVLEKKYDVKREENFLRNYSANKELYKKDVLNIIVLALRNASVDIEKNAPKTTITKYYLEELQNQVKATTKLIKENSRKIPSNYNPYIAYDDLKNRK